jgi:hypothetical protein
LWAHIAELRDYLIDEMKLSERAATARIKRIEDRVMPHGKLLYDAI